MLHGDRTNQSAGKVGSFRGKRFIPNRMGHAG